MGTYNKHIMSTNVRGTALQSSAFRYAGIHAIHSSALLVNELSINMLAHRAINISIDLIYVLCIIHASLSRYTTYWGVKKLTRYER